MKSFFERQIPVIGDKCQNKLKDSTVLVAGVGGIGTSVSELLVRYGVGKLYLTDNGIVDEPDLNRQILYTADDLGKKKVFVAREKLLKITRETEIIANYTEIDENFIIPPDIDIAVDCLDNFKTRYLLDDILAKESIPLVHAGIESFFIQLTTIDRKKIKKLKDVFPNAIDKKNIPVLSSTASVAGAIEALEVIKVLCGMEENLSGKLLIIDLKDYEFEIIRLV